MCLCLLCKRGQQDQAEVTSEAEIGSLVSMYVLIDALASYGPDVLYLQKASKSTSLKEDVRGKRMTPPGKLSSSII